jgi:anaerobic ribonucleoside-triphosphate reductase activating protein
MHNENGIRPGQLNIMGYVNDSRVNGPGSRAVVWVQGCRRACPGCFNPDSWSSATNRLVSVEQLAEDILSFAGHEGVTFSGGEPFLQATALAELARRVKAAGLSVMSFSGYTLEELRSPHAPPGASDLLEQLDILIDSPYIQSLAVHASDSLVSSTNQRVHLFDPSLLDKLSWSSELSEIHIFPDGSQVITGYSGQVEWLIS